MQRRSLLGVMISAMVAPWAAQAQPQGGGGRRFGGIAEDQLLRAIREGRIVSRRNVGSTSVNLRLDLEGDIDAAWKPRSSTHGEKYRAEIAAFRLNRILGLERVPPVISRSIGRRQLGLPNDTVVLFERDNTARGAALYWVPVLRDSGIDRPADIERWSRALRQGGRIEEAQHQKMEEVSTLLVFDMLTGNWDRWSGSNVPAGADGHLIYRDNNGGFDEPFVDASMRQSLAWLRRAQKFRRGVIERARAMTAASVEAEMANDPDAAHRPLSEAQVRSLLRRRDELLRYVDGLVTRHGAERVYAWA
ncbi:MAG: hypothetical protein JNK72_13830 [Myxococcales bacterium]|nr:hypothetical protein [Myxococcales bacterium]